jgi:hypothetical protein
VLGGIVNSIKFAVNVDICGVMVHRSNVDFENQRFTVDIWLGGWWDSSTFDVAMITLF